MSHRKTLTPEASVEARLAAGMATALSARLAELPHDVTERLRFGREQALSRARAARLASGTGVVAVGGGSAALSWRPLWWHRAASALPLVVLLGGLYLVNQWVLQEQVLAAAEIDALLLSDNLPPEAYSDPGFAEFLRSSPTP
jgi:Protein of unknown function (DUF3619)